MNHFVQAIVLAAGESRRMGRPKALLPWGTGNVLEHILETVRQAGLSDTVVVTGAHHRQIAEKCSPSGAQFCFNPDWEKGMGSGICLGVRYLLKKNPDTQGILLLLADQPLIGPEYIGSLLDCFDPVKAAMVASKYPEGPGVPAIFGSSYFNDLAGLAPTRGAKEVLRKNSSRAVLLDPGVAARDMDTPAAYRELKKIAGINNSNKLE